MIKSIERLADKALSLILPETDAWAYKTCQVNRCTDRCSDWTCCLVGTSTFWFRTCPRSSNPADGCYAQFSGKC
jgi:hypothetical protein